MNEIIGEYYTNINNKQICAFKYTHTDFFEDIYNKQNNYIPIDIDMYQYIENDNYVSNKLPLKAVNYISHFFNKHNSKFKFYLNSGNSILIFCEHIPLSVSLTQKNRFATTLKKYNIYNFLFVNILNNGENK